MGAHGENMMILRISDDYCRAKKLTHIMLQEHLADVGQFLAYYML